MVDYQVLLRRKLKESLVEIENEYSSLELDYDEKCKLIIDLPKTILESQGLLNPIMAMLTPFGEYRKYVLNKAEDLADKLFKGVYQKKLTWQDREHRILKYFKQDSGVQNIGNIGKPKLGRGGELSLWVSYHLNGQSKIGFLKVFDDSKDYDQLKLNMDSLSSSWLKSWTSIDFLSSDSIPAIIFDIALSDCAQNDNPDDYSLESYLSTRDKISLAFIVGESIGNKYAENFLSLFSSNTSSALGNATCWQKLIKDVWPNASLSWETSYYWHEALLPSKDEEKLSIGGKILWNPNYLITNDDLLELDDSPISWYQSLQHGDLNLGNVLASSSGSEIKLIDFDKVNEMTSCVLDLCWLSLWALRLASNNSKNIVDFDLDETIECFTRVVFKKEEDDLSDVIYSSVSYKFIDELFGEFRKTLAKSFSILIVNQIKITMSAAAYAMSYYELKSCIRMLQGEGTSKEIKNDLKYKEHRKYAILFMGICSVLINDFVVEEETPNGPAIDLNLSFKSV